MVIYYNPECSKCKHALQLLQNQNCELTIRNYLEESPTVNELEELLKKLNTTVSSLIRKGEDLFVENYEGKDFSDKEWLQILSENPILIERPIVIDGEKAIIGRPPLLVLELVDPSPSPPKGEKKDNI